MYIIAASASASRSIQRLSKLGFPLTARVRKTGKRLEKYTTSIDAKPGSPTTINASSFEVLIVARI